MIAREPGSTTRKAFDDATRAAGIAPRIAMEIGSREAVREAVLQGLGIAVVSEIEFVPDPRLRTLRILDANVQTHAHVVCLKERSRTRIIEAFLGVARELVRRA